jgi:hypothetical protein
MAVTDKKIINENEKVYEMCNENMIKETLKNLS